MYRSRPLDGESMKRQRHAQPMIEVSANYANVPIKDENWSERWFVMPKLFETIANDIINLEVCDDDVFVVTYMKCGTTWMQETAWLLLNDLNYEVSRSANIMARSPFLDFNGLMPITEVNMMDFIAKTPRPRLLKTHMQAHFLPKQAWDKKSKIIYVARNAKDCILSAYYFSTSIKFWNGTLEEFISDFTNDETAYCPFWSHIVDFWKMRNEPNVFFTTYEEMKRDLPTVLQKLSTFLGKPALNAEQMTQITEHLKFDKMKANQSSNPTNMLKAALNDDTDKNFQFMRRGIVGSFKDELSAAQIKLIDDWSRERLSQHGLKEEDIFGAL